MKSKIFFFPIVMVLLSFASCGSGDTNLLFFKDNFDSSGNWTFEHSELAEITGGIEDGVLTFNLTGGAAESQIFSDGAALLSPLPDVKPLPSGSDLKIEVRVTYMHCSSSDCAVGFIMHYGTTQISINLKEASGDPLGSIPTESKFILITGANPTLTLNGVPVQLGVFTVVISTVSESSYSIKFTEGNFNGNSTQLKISALKVSAVPQ